MQPEELTERVRAVAAPLAADAGLDLVESSVRGQSPKRLVRVVVDRKGGVDLETCGALSRELEPRLDALTELDGAYALEVTSPGLDYPLRDRRAFDRVEGRLVLVHHRGEDGRVQQLRGTVQAAEAEEVLLEVDGAPLRVRYDDIQKATQSLPW